MDPLGWLSSNHQRVAHTGRNKELGARRTRWYWRLRLVPGSGEGSVGSGFGTGCGIRSGRYRLVSRYALAANPPLALFLPQIIEPASPSIQANPLGELYYCSCASHALPSDPSIRALTRASALLRVLGRQLGAFCIWCRISRIWLVGRLAHRRLPIPSGRLDRWFFRVVGRLTAGCLAFAIDLRLSSSMWFDRHKLFRSSDSSVAIYVGDECVRPFVPVALPAIVVIQLALVLAIELALVIFRRVPDRFARYTDINFGIVPADRLQPCGRDHGLFPGTDASCGYRPPHTGSPSSGRQR